MARLRGSCSPLCDFRLLRCADSLHPSGHGGALSFLARAPSALVRMTEGLRQRGKIALLNYNF